MHDQIQVMADAEMARLRPLADAMDRVLERVDQAIVERAGEASFERLLVARVEALTGETVPIGAARIFDRLKRFEPTRHRMVNFDPAAQAWTGDEPMRTDAELIAVALKEWQDVIAFTGSPEGRTIRAIEDARRAFSTAGQAVCAMDGARSRDFAGNRPTLAALARELGEAAMVLSAAATAAEIALAETV
jgi:hypothetical protein